MGHFAKATAYFLILDDNNQPALNDDLPEVVSEFVVMAKRMGGKTKPQRTILTAPFESWCLI